MLDGFDLKFPPKHSMQGIATTLIDILIKAEDNRGLANLCWAVSDILRSDKFFIMAFNDDGLVTKLVKLAKSEEMKVKTPVYYLLCFLTEMEKEHAFGCDNCLGH